MVKCTQANLKFLTGLITFLKIFCIKVVVSFLSSETQKKRHVIYNKGRLQRLDSLNQYLPFLCKTYLNICFTYFPLLNLQSHYISSHHIFS